MPKPGHRCLALIAALLVLQAFSGAAFAQSISIAQSSGPGATMVTATLGGFAQWPLAIYASTAPFTNANEVAPQISSCTPDASGSCTVTLTMPTNPGVYYIVAADSEFGQYANANTTWTTLQPTVTISPTCGPTGTVVTAKGTQFAINSATNSNGMVYVVLDGNFSPWITLISPDSSGNFTQAFAIPTSGSGGSPLTSGAHTISFENSEGADVSLEFDLPGCAQIGKVTSVTGLVTDGGQPLSVGSPVYQDDTLVAPPGTQALITFNDTTQLNIAGTSTENTTLVLNNYSYTPGGAAPQGGFLWQAAIGAFEYVGGLIGSNATSPPDNKLMLLQTPGLSGPGIPVGIRGTQFIAWPGTVANSVELDLIAGTVAITPSQSVAQSVFTAPLTLIVSSTGVTTTSLTQTQYSAIRSTLLPSAAAPDTTPPVVTLSFATVPGGQAGYFNGSQIPVVGSVSATDPSKVAAIQCTDSLSGLTEGALSGGGTVTASRTLSVLGDGSHSVACTATDGASNSGAATGSVNTATLNIDATPPTVTYTGNAGSYTATQTIAITCVAADALSGVASTTCVNINGLASSFGAGTHNYSATATDKAGNVGSGSTSFTVTGVGATTFQSTEQLVSSADSQFLVKAELDLTLLAASTAFQLKAVALGDELLNVFIQETEAQTGKSLTAAQVGTLVQDAKSLMR